MMMYNRLPLSLRNVEDLLHERGVDISHEAAVELADHLCRAVRLVGDDCKRLITPNCVSRLTQECPCCLGIAPRRQSEIDQLAELIHRTPKVTAKPAHTKLGLIDMPSQSAPGAVLGVGPFPDFGAKLPHAPLTVEASTVMPRSARKSCTSRHESG